MNKEVFVIARRRTADYIVCVIDNVDSDDVDVVVVVDDDNDI